MTLHTHGMLLVTETNNEEITSGLMESSIPMTNVNLWTAGQNRPTLNSIRVCIVLNGKVFLITV
jgi:hypothetical protein